MINYSETRLTRGPDKGKIRGTMTITLDEQDERLWALAGEIRDTYGEKRKGCVGLAQLLGRMLGNKVEDVRDRLEHLHKKERDKIVAEYKPKRKTKRRSKKQ